MREGEAANSKARRGIFSFATPLAICLPCLRPFILAAVLIGAGVGSVGSFFSDNAFLLAILIALSMLVVFVIGLGVARLARWRGGGYQKPLTEGLRRIEQGALQGDER
jgi:sulfite exporter TauE/SafE